MDLDLPRFCRELVTRAADAVIYADNEGVIRFWNPAATRIFGFTEAEAVGQSLDLIIPQNLRQRHWQGFDATMRSGESRYGAGDILAVPASRKDGSRISVEFTIVLFKGDDGKVAGIAATLRDVTTRFEQIRALQRELAALRAAAQPAKPA
jgi:PAS domain S-box-containing protein